jgi:hypothetical protein
MVYEKPELALLGTPASLVLGAANEGGADNGNESNHRRASDVEAGLDD